MAGTVSWISMTPVKGMRMHELEAVELTLEGVAGDRAFFLVDPDGAMVNAKRFGALLEIVPTHDAAAGTLTLALPDGSKVTGEVELGRPEPVTFYGQPQTVRPVAGEFSAAISAVAGAELRLMAEPHGRSGVDRGRSGGVTLLGETSLASLREAGRTFNRERGSGNGEGADPGPIDRRRFRMTFGLQGTEAYEEDGWISRQVQVGAARVRVEAHVGRCAITTRDPDTGRPDLKTLHFLNASRREVASSEPLPFGVYGEVLEPGTVRLGDPVSLR